MVPVFLGVDCSFDKVHLPDWLVAVIAAVAGSIVGILFGFLLYWCCCKRYCPMTTLYYAEHVHIAQTRTRISTPCFYVRNGTRVRVCTRVRHRQCK